MAHIRSGGLAAVLVTTLACSGQIGGPPEDRGLPGPHEPTPVAGIAPLAQPGVPALAPPPTAPGALTAGPMPVRALTEREYRNTVRDLLGVDPHTVELPLDERSRWGFAEAISGSEGAVERYHQAAHALAVAALARDPKLVPCAPETASDACVTDFVGRFGRRAFRRPLAPDQLSDFQALYRKLVADPQVRPAERFPLLIEAFLTAPEFLYRGPTTRGRAGAIVPLDAWEVASRLSYALWATMPDEALFAAAEGGTLLVPAELEKQTRRLLASTRSLEALRSFVEHWMEIEELGRIEKDAKKFSLFTEALKTSLSAEVDRFLEGVLVSGDGRLETLLTAPFSYVDSTAAKLYGVTSAGATVRTPLDRTQRAGLLTQGAFLAMHASKVDSHPIKRGKVIFGQFLCGTMPPPPQDIPPPRPAAPDVTTRERYAQHGQAECARACHQLLDPLGFAFENYDAVGAWRTTESGRRVDASGELILPATGKRHPFTNAVQLAGILAGLDEVRACVSTQWLRFALGRLDVPADAASIAGAAGVMTRAGGDLRELVVALMKSPSFLNRSIPEATP